MRMRRRRGAHARRCCMRPLRRASSRRSTCAASWCAPRPSPPPFSMARPFKVAPLRAPWERCCRARWPTARPRPPRARVCWVSPRSPTWPARRTAPRSSSPRRAGRCGRAPSSWCCTTSRTPPARRQLSGTTWLSSCRYPGPTMLGASYGVVASAYPCVMPSATRATSAHTARRRAGCCCASASCSCVVATRPGASLSQWSWPRRSSCCARRPSAPTTRPSPPS
mmetsp:Transcript_796/g.1993  ORF Transcript_796/g.1993 Transcript_796/m.1993 type:complete len:224 (-) Transcript_796:229-900(-)